MREVLADLITSLDGYAVGGGPAGVSGLEGDRATETSHVGPAGASDRAGAVQSRGERFVRSAGSTVVTITVFLLPFVRSNTNPQRSYVARVAL